MDYLKPQVKPNATKSGKFGRCGRMVIKPYSIPTELIQKYKHVFFKYVTVSVCGCWEWQGRVHNGYGCFPEPGGSTKWSHRVSYALFIGPIKAQMHIDHRCRNKKCVNPAHLQQVTPQENYKAIYRRKLRDEKYLKESMGQLKLW